MKLRCMLFIALALVTTSFAEAQLTSFLGRLPELKNAVTRKISSFDRSGGNKDFLTIRKDTTVTIADLKGPGCITHIWVTISAADKYHLRKILVRMYWDGETNPSVNCPIGDFFGLGFCQPHYWSSLPLSAAWRALNCYFPMPYEHRARIDIVNDCDSDIGSFYFNIDYDTYPDAAPVKDLGRFHAFWNRQSTTQPSSDTANVTGNSNYLILDAEGQGQYVGTLMYIQGMSTGWWGEGDDMVFVDGERWPPSFHGTGLEDYFLGAWNFNGVSQEYNTPFYGYSLQGNKDYTGQHAMYRFHILDPIVFKKSLRFTIEHGHNNKRADDYASVAFWYQKEPHKPFTVPDVSKRIPTDSWLITPQEKDTH